MPLVHHVVLPFLGAGFLRQSMGMGAWVAPVGFFVEFRKF